MDKFIQTLGQLLSKKFTVFILILALHFLTINPIYFVIRNRVKSQGI